MTMRCTSMSTPAAFGQKVLRQGLDPVWTWRAAWHDATEHAGYLLITRQIAFEQSDDRSGLRREEGLPLQLRHNSLAHHQRHHHGARISSITVSCYWKPHLLEPSVCVAYCKFSLCTCVIQDASATGPLCISANELVKPPQHIRPGFLSVDMWPVELLELLACCVVVCPESPKTEGLKYIPDNRDACLTGGEPQWGPPQPTSGPSGGAPQPYHAQAGGGTTQSAPMQPAQAPPPAGAP